MDANSIASLIKTSENLSVISLLFLCLVYQTWQVNSVLKSIKTSVQAAFSDNKSVLDTIAAQGAEQAKIFQTLSNWTKENCTQVKSELDTIKALNTEILAEMKAINRILHHTN